MKKLGVRGVAEIPTPTLDKMHAVHERSQSIGEFLEWLQQRGIRLAKPHRHTDECEDAYLGHHECGYHEGALEPAYQSTEKLLAQFFEIDLDAAEREKRAILKTLQEAQKC